MKAKNILFGALAVAGGFLFSACMCSQDYLFEQEPTITEGFTGTVVRAVSPPKTDILFLIDSSGSMTEEQRALRANLGHFIAKLAESSNDYQIAVITPDINSDPKQRIPHCTCKPENIFEESNQNNKCCAPENRIIDKDNNIFRCEQFDCLEIVEAEKFVKTTTGKRYLKAPRPDPIEFNRPEAYEAEKRKLQKELICEFQEIVNITGGYTSEQGLEAIRRALQNPHTNPPTLDAEGNVVAEGGANYGFLRDDASLVLILVSDEEDCSHQDMLNKDIPVYELDSTCYPFNYDYEFVDVSSGQKECRLFSEIYDLTGEGYAKCDEFTNASGSGEYCICDTASFPPGESPSLNNCGASIKIDPLVSVDSYVNFIRAKKGNKKDAVNVAVIAALEVIKDGDRFLDAVGKDCCDTQYGAGRAAPRYVDFAKKVNPDNWRAENICTGDYKCALLQVAAIINAASFYRLSAAPKCANFMQVKVMLGKEEIEVDPKCYGSALHPDCPDSPVSEAPEGYSAWIYIPPEFGGPGLKFEGRAKVLMEQGAMLELNFAEVSGESDFGCGGDKYEKFMKSPAVERESVQLNIADVCEAELDEDLANTQCN